MEFPTKSLEELGPDELGQLTIYGLRACKSQAQRDRLAKAVTDMATRQVDAAIYMNDLWSEFDYDCARNFINNYLKGHLHGENFHSYE